MRKEVIKVHSLEKVVGRLRAGKAHEGRVEASAEVSPSSPSNATDRGVGFVGAGGFAIC
jgi:hypothetical protein